LKIISPQVIHKSDVGGVVLNLNSGEEVRAAAVKMRQQVARLQPDARVRGFAVQAMAQRPGSRELIVGLSNDPVFGPVMLCGSGGTDVELSQQHAVALPPLNALLARDLVERSRVSTLLRSWRGRPAANEPALLDVLLKVSQMACDLDGLAELDINPLLVDAQDVLALDARVRVRNPQALVPLAVRPYPHGLSESVQLAGSELLLRPIRPEDGNRLKSFYENAPATDMRLRFFLSRREVPQSELARFSQIDYDREMAFVALAPVDDQGRQEMVGEVRGICDPDNRTAEFAMQVASAWQGKGLGRKLLGKLLQHLRERRTGEVVGQCLPENAAMAGLARSLGFTVGQGAPSEYTSLHLALR
jgi:acetyltransferase